MRQSDAKEDRRQERLCNSLAQSVSMSVNTTLDKLVRTTLVPSKYRKHLYCTLSNMKLCFSL